jgi:hypothetical protein
MDLIIMNVTHLWIHTMKPASSLLSFTLLGLLSFQLHADWSGNVTVQDRYFIDDPLTTNSAQYVNYLSLSSEVEFYRAWNNDESSINITPFFRVDQYDEERTHGDLREMYYQQTFDTWELRLGISKVYWGVTESQHLVDVINQTDSIESIDGEDKLGQPMIMASFEKDWGTVDVFILPYFRERTFQGIEGRPRTSLVIDTDQVSYESSDEEQNIDYALRWFHFIGDLEIGLSYFNGTSREPLFKLGNSNGSAVLTPHYPLMQQAGLDAQLTTEEWLWKLEVIARDWQVFNETNTQLIDQSFIALTGGFEYTFVGIADSDADLGLVTEYLYDDRNKQASSFFQNDLLVGLRLAMNDAESSEALLGVIYDLDYQEYLISLEASRRFADSWTAALEVRIFNKIDNDSLLNNIAKDDFIQLDIAYHF